jgi:hypothetical protein
MIPIGERCKECGKVHIIKSMDEFERLSPRMKAQAYRTEHRIFQSGYYKSFLDVDSETIWEIYLPLSVFKIERVQEEEPKEERTPIEKLTEEYYEVEEEEDL